MVCKILGHPFSPFAQDIFGGKHFADLEGSLYGKKRQIVFETLPKIGINLVYKSGLRFEEMPKLKVRKRPLPLSLVAFSSLVME